MNYLQARKRQIEVLNPDPPKNAERDQFISDLLQDTELSPKEKMDLLSMGYGEDRWNLGMFIANYNQADTINKYLSLLEQLLMDGILAVEILSLLAKVFDANFHHNVSFCFLVVTRKSPDKTIKHFFKLLKELHDRGISLDDIFALLNETFQTKKSGEKHTFFYFTATNYDMSLLVSMIKTKLSQIISFDQLHTNHLAFLAQFRKSQQQVYNLMDLLPEKYYDKELALLNHIKLIYRNNALATEYTISDISILPYLCSFLDFPQCKKYSAIHFQCELKDERLIPVLATIFRKAAIITFKNCRIGQASMPLLVESQRLAGADKVKKVEFKEGVEVDKAIVKDLLAWVREFPGLTYILKYYNKERLTLKTISTTLHYVPKIDIYWPISTDDCTQLMQSLLDDKFVTLVGAYQNSLVIRDPHVIALRITYTEMTLSMFEGDAFLKFLNSMSGLETLRLEDLTFEDEKTRLLCIMQALLKPGLKTLIINFAINDDDLHMVMDLLKKNTCLTSLQLLEGNFDKETLVKFAETVRDSNLTLTDIKLDPKYRVPQLLTDVINRNNKRDELARQQQTIESLLKRIDNSGSVVVGLNADAILHDLLTAHSMSLDLKRQYYPSPILAAQLCEKVAVSYSFLLTKISFKSLNRNTPQPKVLEILRLSDNFIPHLESAEEQLIFYQNMYAFCHSCYDNLARTAGEPAANLREELYRVLLRIPATNDLLFRNVNNLLFSLIHENIVDMLEHVNDPAIQALAKNVKVSTEIKELLNQVTQYLYPPPDQQFSIKKVTKVFTNTFILSNVRTRLHNAYVELQQLNKREQQLPQGALISTASMPINSPVPLLSPPASSAPSLPSLTPLSDTGELKVSRLPPSAPAELPLAAPPLPDEKYTRITELMLQLQQKGVDPDAGAPPELKCPLSLHIMYDPVIAADGHVYERNQITQWINIKLQKELPVISPKDNKTVFKSYDLFPAQHYRTEIIQHLQTKLELANKDAEIQRALSALAVSSTDKQNTYLRLLTGEILPAVDAGAQSSQGISQLMQTHGLNSPVFTLAPTPTAPAPATAPVAPTPVPAVTVAPALVPAPALAATAPAGEMPVFPAALDHALPVVVRSDSPVAPAPQGEQEYAEKRLAHAS